MRWPIAGYGGAGGVAVALLAVGCTYGPPGVAAGESGAAAATDAAAPFHFTMTEEGAMDLRVVSKGVPIASAVIVVRATTADADLGQNPEVAAPDVLWQGMTDAQGHATGKWVRRATVDTVQITVLKPGFRGPYVSEAARTAHGAFAPASWQKVAVAQLTGFQIELTETGAQ